MDESDPLSGGQRKAEDTTKCLKWRYSFAILGCMGMCIIYGLKVNLSIAVVSMVNHTALAELKMQEGGNGTDDHGGGHGEGGDEELADGPFVWNSKQQGAILSSYFLGYFITQIPGGRMAELYSGKYVFLVATLMNTVGALLTPICSVLDYRVLMAVRVMQGLGGGFTFPAMNVLIAAWSPPNERSTISSIAYSGASLGTVLSMLSSGVISSLVGWEAIFYIQGGLSVVWCLMWFIFVSDSPKGNRFTSEEEQHFIESCKASTQAKSSDDGGHGGAPSSGGPKVPWIKIFTSVPFMTLAFAHFCNNVGWYMLLVELPLFARTGLKVNMTYNTIISCVPFFANWIFSVIYSKTLDFFRSKGKINTTNARKLSVLMSSVVPGVCLLGICWSGENIPAVVTLTIMAVMFYGSMYSGVFSNHSDLAPNFAGTLMAFTNMVATIPGFLVPMVVGILTSGDEGLGPWHIVFYGTAVVLACEAVLYVIFGKGEMQTWNNP